MKFDLLSSYKEKFDFCLDTLKRNIFIDGLLEFMMEYYIQENNT